MRAMKKCLVLCAFLVGSAFAHMQGAASSPVRSNCKDIDKVARQIADDWKEGYNSGNPDKVAALYSEDAYYLTQHFVTGIVQGRVNIRAYVQLGLTPSITSMPSGFSPPIAQATWHIPL